MHRSRLNAQTERQLRQLQSLHAIDTAITSRFDPHISLGIFLEHALAQLHVDAGCILLINPQTGLLEYLAGRGFRTAVIEHAQLRLGEGAIGRAALEKRTMGTDLSAIDGSDERVQLLAGEDFVSQYQAPLIVKGEKSSSAPSSARTPIG
jgi:signal transduction protein with GAF and PtsI domain